MIVAMGTPLLSGTHPLQVSSWPEAKANEITQQTTRETACKQHAFLRGVHI